MDFVDQLEALASNIPNQLDHILTEEATKSALVMPFIQTLGYNVFDITEVVPEFNANVGASKKYKLDYAILQEGKPIILIECKHHSEKLDKDAHSQLFHYFAATDARVGILTNGITYRFYSDLAEANKLDEKPFLEIDMLNLQEALVVELKKLTKQSFNLDEILTAASELKYTREIKRILAEQLNEPSEEFVKFFAAQIYAGRVNARVRQEFTGFVKRAFKQFIREQISGLLQSASNLADDELSKPPSSSGQDTAEALDEDNQENRIVTTDEELEGFYIVKSILCQVIAPRRVIQRDAVTYFSVLLDNNNRKPICRLYFNNPENKRLGLFDHSEDRRTEEKVSIANTDEIYQYADRLKATIAHYNESN